MVCKGIIKSIDYNSNTCMVRMPIFESAGGGDEAVAEAIIAIQPGIYNGYKIDDVVIVSFENNQLQRPVIIGKLYLNTPAEKENARSAVVCNSLVATESCELPLTTKLSSSNAGTKISLAGDKSSYKTLADITNKLQELENNVTHNNIKYYMHYLAIEGNSYNATYVKLLSTRTEPYTINDIQELSEVMAPNLQATDNLKNNIIEAYWEYDTNGVDAWRYYGGHQAWAIYLDYNTSANAWYLHYWSSFITSNGQVNATETAEPVSAINDIVKPI